VSAEGVALGRLLGEIDDAPPGGFTSRIHRLAAASFHRTSSRWNGVERMVREAVPLRSCSLPYDVPSVALTESTGTGRDRLPEGSVPDSRARAHVFATPSNRTERRPRSGRA
jgi:hypothetical protein